MDQKKIPLANRNSPGGENYQGAYRLLVLFKAEPFTQGSAKSRVCDMGKECPCPHHHHPPICCAGVCAQWKLRGTLPDVLLTNSTGGNWVPNSEMIARKLKNRLFSRNFPWEKLLVHHHPGLRTESLPRILLEALGAWNGPFCLTPGKSESS